MVKQTPSIMVQSILPASSTRCTALPLLLQGGLLQGGRKTPSVSGIRMGRSAGLLLPRNHIGMTCTSNRKPMLLQKSLHWKRKDVIPLALPTRITTTPPPPSTWHAEGGSGAQVKHDHGDLAHSSMLYVTVDAKLKCKSSIFKRFLVGG